jgi:hypothetical protein
MLTSAKIGKQNGDTRTRKTETGYLNLSIGWGFRDIQNYQGWGKSVISRAEGEIGNTYWDLGNSRYHKNRI